MVRTILVCLSALLTFTAFSQGNSGKRSDIFDACEPQRSSGTFLYTLNTSMDTYVELSGGTSINNGEIWDEPTYNFNIGFPFELLNNSVTNFQFLGSGSLMGAQTANPDITAILFPFETDLIDRGAIGGTSLSPISYLVEGTAPNRILKLEFRNAGSYYEMADLGTLDMFISFQMWLYEGTNKIEFRFGPSSIDDPDIFYGGATGAFLGLGEVDLINEIFYNLHFLIGPPPSPTLLDDVTAMDGTPANGIVYELTISLPLEVDITAVNSTSACEPNGSATAQPTGGVEPYSYLWSNNETTQTISNLGAGTYTVTVTDDASTTATASVVITGIDPIAVNASATDETAVDANDGTATAAPTGGSPPYTYEWSNGETTQTITGLSPGIYTVTVTDDEGCTAEETVTVNAFGCPDISLETGITQISCFGICDGAINIIQVIGGTPPYTYIWSNGAATASITNLCEGDYFVTVLDSDGCSVSEAYQIVEPLPLFANAGSTDETAQSANDGTAWAAPVGGTSPYTYLWSTGSTDSLITNLPPGGYLVTVTDANLCMATDSVTVDSFGCSILEVQIIDNSCFGECDGSITLVIINAVDPVTYTWSNGDSTATIDSLCAGNYSVTATDAEGCTVTASVIVSEPDEVQANLVTTDETGPLAADGTASVSPTGGVAPYVIAWSTGSSDSTITGLAPGIYFVAIQDALGCVDFQVFQINQFPCMGSLESGSTDASCFEVCDGSASVAVIGGIGPFTYEWSQGDTLADVMGLCAGLYDVTITDEGQNCVGVVSIFISQPDELEVSIDDITHITDSTSSSVSITVTGGTPPYAYEWFTPGGGILTDEDIAGVEAGNYTVVVTDTNGCVVQVDSIEVIDFTVSISEPPFPDLRIYPNPARDAIYIDLHQAEEYEIQLRSADGRLAGKWKQVNMINVSAFPSGIYTLSITSGNKFYAHRVMISRR